METAIQFFSNSNRPPYSACRRPNHSPTYKAPDRWAAVAEESPFGVSIAGLYSILLKDEPEKVLKKSKKKKKVITNNESTNVGLKLVKDFSKRREGSIKVYHRRLDGGACKRFDGIGIWAATPW